MGQRIQAKCNICVNFSDHDTNYYSAYKYVCKEDNCVVKRENHKITQVLLKHLKLLELEKVQTEMKFLKQKGQKVKELDILAIYDVIIRNNLQLCAVRNR